ncbi:unnamed protein product [Leptosia nina]|uniref:Uncharacterized protein n=1 Tax=Leptosia nina TaxID=320188 RepID=A0AAV1JVS6_9NEOP
MRPASWRAIPHGVSAWHGGGGTARPSDTATLPRRASCERDERLPYYLRATLPRRSAYVDYEDTAFTKSKTIRVPHLNNTKDNICQFEGDRKPVLVYLLKTSAKTSVPQRAFEVTKAFSVVSNRISNRERSGVLGLAGCGRGVRAANEIVRSTQAAGDVCRRPMATVLAALRLLQTGCRVLLSPSVRRASFSKCGSFDLSFVFCIAASHRKINRHFGLAARREGLDVIYSVCREINIRSSGRGR